MRLLHRRRPGPRAKTARPDAERYLAAGAEEARRLGHNYVGTEHILSVLIRNPDGEATRVLARLGVGAEAADAAVAGWLSTGTRPAGGGKLASSRSPGRALCSFNIRACTRRAAELAPLSWDIVPASPRPTQTPTRNFFDHAMVQASR